jgi:putative membrane protein
LENINLLLQNYLLLVIIVLLALVIMLYVMYKGQKKELQVLKEKYDFFTQGDNVNWDELLTKTLTEVRAAKAEMQALEENQQAMREQMKSCVQKVKLMRYNAFSDTGSDLSYSLSLLDENNNGVVLSSIYGREDNRTYAKPIENGKSTYNLSEEEKKVLP